LIVINNDFYKLFYGGMPILRANIHCHLQTQSLEYSQHSQIQTASCFRNFQRHLYSLAFNVRW